MDLYAFGNGWESSSSPGRSTIDRNLQQLLQERHRYSGYGATSPVCDATGLRGSFETQDVSEDPLGPSRIGGCDVGPFTPDRPTMRRERSPPPDVATAAAWGQGTERFHIEVGSEQRPWPARHNLNQHSRHVDPAISSSSNRPQSPWAGGEPSRLMETSAQGSRDYSYQHQQQQQLRVAQLVAALDSARQEALVHARESQSVRAALAACEDQLERARCEHAFVAGCYKRDRAYFVKFALATVQMMEECCRRELSAREAEWRGFLRLEHVEETAAVMQAAAVAAAAVAPGPVPFSAVPLATGGGVLSSDGPALKPPLSPPRADGRAVAASLGTSPRSHRTPRRDYRREGEGDRSPGLPLPGSESSGRVMHCRATLLSEVAAAKRELEETCASLKVQLRGEQEAAVVREKEYCARIAELEERLRAEEELTTDMQDEIDDMLTSELAAREGHERLVIAEEAGRAVTDLLLEFHKQTVTMLANDLAEQRAQVCERGQGSQFTDPLATFPADDAGNEGEGAGGDANGVAAMETEGNPLLPEGSFVTLHDRRGSRDPDASPSDTTVPDVGTTSSGARRGMRAEESLTVARAPGNDGKNVLKALIMRDASAGKLSPPPTTLYRLSRELNELKDGVLGDLKALQMASLQRMVPRGSPSLLPLSPTAVASAPGGCDHQSSEKGEVLEVLTPLTGAFPLPNSRDGSKSRATPASAASQGVTPEQPHQQRTLGTVFEEQFQSAERHLSSPLCSSGAGKQVRFDMPHFPTTAVGATERSPSALSFTGGGGAAALVSPSACEESASEWTMTTTMSSAGGSRQALKVPGEELFQPQALSFPSMPSNMWDLVDSDDESVPTPPMANSHSRLSATHATTTHHTHHKVRPRTSYPVNPYDGED